MGLSFYGREKQFGHKRWQELLERATLQAIQDQEEAGTDIVSDGEERRGHYVLHILRNLGGVDLTKLTETTIRDGKYLRSLPTVVDQITYREPITVAEFGFLKQNAKGLPKVNLPGPTTVIDSVADGFYQGDRKRMAEDYAKAIHHEVEHLIDAGCTIIQFDDPVLLRDPKGAKEWGLTILEQCFAGLEDQATFIVHICCGYPDKPLEEKGVQYKADHHYYSDVLSWLSKSSLDIVSIEGAQSDLEVSVLPAIGEKTVMLGVIDVGSNEVETVGALVEHGRRALAYLPPEQLILAPDCGLIELDRESAKRKLLNLSKAQRILNASPQG